MVRAGKPTPLPSWRKAIHALRRDDAWALLPVAVIVLGACFA